MSQSEPTPRVPNETPEGFSQEHQRIRRAYSLRGALDSLYFGMEDPAHCLRLEQRYRASRRLLSEAGFDPLGEKVILDVGCGEGQMLLELLQWGAAPSKLAGIDLRPSPIEQARALLPANVDLRQGCASQLPWKDASIDLVCMHTVMSSILDPDLRRQVAVEVTRVLTEDGALLWYDTLRENPKNPNVAAVSRAELKALFPTLRGEMKKITFLPHLARRLPVRPLTALYPLLASLPGCRSHLLALLRRAPAGQSSG